METLTGITNRTITFGLPHDTTGLRSVRKPAGTEVYVTIRGNRVYARVPGTELRQEIRINDITVP